MSNHAELIQIADLVSATDPALACRLRALAARVRAQERCLDEIVESSSLEHHDAWVSLITQAENALQAMWDTFGDLSDNQMLGMPCRGALVKCRAALAAIEKAKRG